MIYLIDSDWLIDAFGGRAPALLLLEGLAGGSPAISTISVAEVCEGAFGAPDPEMALARIERFLAQFTALPVTENVAVRFAEIRATLRRQGRPLADMDLLIAATALEHDLTLVSRNARHFARVPGLRLH
ncbi:MAG: type II toxin-antitoxin system VapC family toxin [Thermomicrobiales bacterium]